MKPQASKKRYKTFFYLKYWQTWKKNLEPSLPAPIRFSCTIYQCCYLLHNWILIFIVLSKSKVKKLNQLKRPIKFFSLKIKARGNAIEVGEKEQSYQTFKVTKHFCRKTFFFWWCIIDFWYYLPIKSQIILNFIESF